LVWPGAFFEGLWKIRKDVGGKTVLTREPQHELSFGADTSEKTGQPKYAINEKVSRAEKAAPGLGEIIAACYPIEVGGAGIVLHVAATVKSQVEPNQASPYGSVPVAH
jgi:hypothetical protein